MSIVIILSVVNVIVYTINKVLMWYIFFNDVTFFLLKKLQKLFDLSETYNYQIFNMIPNG